MDGYAMSLVCFFLRSDSGFLCLRSASSTVLLMQNARVCETIIRVYPGKVPKTVIMLSILIIPLRTKTSVVLYRP